MKVKELREILEKCDGNYDVFAITNMDNDDLVTDAYLVTAAFQVTAIGNKGYAKKVQGLYMKTI